MKALRVLAHGEPPQICDIARPAPAPGEVLVQTMAVGLNFSDLLLIEGTYQRTPPLPFTLGMECAGIVLEVGLGVSCLSPGDRVAVFSGHGGLAEFGTFPAKLCRKIPASMPWEQAAAFQIAYGTSDIALCECAKLKPGETVAILGAAGGVGLTAVQIAKAAGARVIAVARGNTRLAVAKKAGADYLVNSEEDDLRVQIKSLGGADVVYDAVGGTQGTEAFRALRPFGRYIIIGFASGEQPQLPFNIALVKNIQIIGVNWGAFASAYPDTLTKSFDRLLEMFDAGQIAPVIGQTLPFDQATEALDLIKTRKATGKIVVTMP